ncbi:DUF4393 domain-containing protein [Bacillus pseudomycoides]|uniref:DUF4393 domain-containing protein n=1 Tax=Bacillus pseudomycoides TaxID=64104 RepID=UPI000BF4F653|nr:DUF4393 domain-containing protein [Bacillus pseudomycoides]PGC53828.1 hypothetical protein COM14_02495 [Bacillus pseudomycoides]PGD28037.1 hypothetical protein COM30_20780 [Bacillus pseudomycoides]
MEINLMPKFLEEALTPVAQRAGNTISSIWTIAFGGIDIYAEKTQLKRVHALNQFKYELEQKVSSIPEENIVEPPLHIVGPSLEASKYYFESDVLRSMFSNLIAASINTETIAKAHPSFVEIIKQLSPLDAMNLKLFKSGNRYPIVQYVYTSVQGIGNQPFKSNVFLENEEIQDIDLNATSISNLNRLGLVKISYTEQLTTVSRYDKFNNHEFALKSRQKLKDLALNSDPLSINHTDISIRKGVVDITPLGESFIEICI